MEKAQIAENRRLGSKTRKHSQHVSDLQAAKKICSQYRFGAQSQLESSGAQGSACLGRASLDPALQQLFCETAQVLDVSIRNIVQRIGSFNAFYQTQLDVSGPLGRMRDRVVYLFDCAAEGRPSLQQERIRAFEGKYGSQFAQGAERPLCQRCGCQFERLYENEQTLFEQREEALNQQIRELQEQNQALSRRIADQTAKSGVLEVETLELQKSRIAELAKSEARTRLENSQLRLQMQEIANTRREADRQILDLRLALQSKKSELGECQREVDELIQALHELE